MLTRANRSPSYPSISLPDAVERLRTLYDHEGTTPADREVIAQALGYKSRNGASDAILAAIAHYGLLEDAGERRLRISSAGLDIILGETGNPEYEKAIQESALTPTLFATLSSEFGSGKYSNRNVESYLIKNGFNPPAATKAARAFRDTIEFVNRETSGRQISASSAQAGTSQNRLADELILPPPRMPPAQDATTQRSLSIPIDEDMDVQLVFRGHLTDERIQTLIEYLQIMQRRFAKRQSMVPGDETPEAG